jgi:putative zinc finger/helix-turn-helix YgiT family protein
VEKAICLACRKEIIPELELRKEVFQVRGEDIEVESEVAVCHDCGEELSVEELDDITLDRAFAEYRRRHNLLSPEEIVALRKKYGLSQRALSLLLGWGEITLHRYETGSLQDPAHDAQLRMAADPRNLRPLLAVNGHRLTARQRTKLEASLAGTQAAGFDDIEECSWPSLVRTSVDEFTGFRAFEIRKFTEMVVYFASLSRMFRTKLNKLLFYSDFLSFKQSTLSISGAPYLAFQRGPVPQHYDWITEALEQQGDIRTVEWTYGEKSGEYFEAARKADLSIFSEPELRVLAFIRDGFASATSKRLTDLSHAEAAYLNTPAQGLISYLWASDLSVSLPD